MYCDSDEKSSKRKKKRLNNKNISREKKVGEGGVSRESGKC